MTSYPEIGRSYGTGLADSGPNSRLLPITSDLDSSRSQAHLVQLPDRHYFQAR